MSTGARNPSSTKVAIALPASAISLPASTPRSSQPRNHNARRRGRVQMTAERLRQYSAAMSDVSAAPLRSADGGHAAEVERAGLPAPQLGVQLVPGIEGPLVAVPSSWGTMVYLTELARM